MRDLMRAGTSGILLLLMMLLGSLTLWVGVPVGWLYVGSMVQAATGSLSTALAAMALGVVASILVIVWVLGWLSRKHGELREARGLESHGHVALEGILAASAGIAIVGLTIWFFLFSGASPIPLYGP
jgi:heme/copper-type cytochrome/quinol oxidase subunit 2